MSDRSTKDSLLLKKNNAEVRTSIDDDNEAPPNCSNQGGVEVIQDAAQTTAVHASLEIITDHMNIAPLPVEHIAATMEETDDSCNGKSAIMKKKISSNDVVAHVVAHNRVHGGTQRHVERIQPIYHTSDERGHSPATNALPPNITGLQGGERIIRPTPTLHEHSDLDQSLPEPSAPVFHVLEATLVDDVVYDAIPFEMDKYDRPLQDNLPMDQNAGSYNPGWCKRHARSVYIGIATIAVVVIGTTVAILMTTNNQTKSIAQDIFEWKEQDRPIIGNEFENFLGTSVALSADGSILAVGAPGLLGGNSTGYVQLYNMSSGSRWIQIGADIKGNVTGDNFGSSVALSADGTTLAVGASAYTSYGDPNAISGYVRVYSVFGIGGQIGQDIIGEAAADLSGAFVSLSGDGKTVAIGAPGNDGNGDVSGHVRVYQMRNSESNWIQLGQDIDGEAEWDQSGLAVSLSADGKTVAIGSPYLNDDVDWNYGQVRVYYFDEYASSWVQQGLDLVGDFSGDEFGRSVALSADGNILAIGAPTYDEAVSPGYVKVYHLQDDDWKQMGNDMKATTDKGYFGQSISLSEDGKTVAVGDYYTNENGADVPSVSIYQFDDLSSIWIQRGKINGDTSDQFGYAVSLSADGNMVAIGVPDRGDGRGNVRVFKNDV